MYANRKPNFSSLPENNFKNSEAEQQYRVIGEIDWSEVAGKAVSTLSTAEFWTMVAAGEKTAEIGKYGLSLLLMPLSNASTERIFSSTGAFKTKRRSTMICSTLDSLVRIKEEFNTIGKCCDKFEITNSMIDLHCLGMYKDN